MGILGAIGLNAEDGMAADGTGVSRRAYASPGLHAMDRPVQAPIPNGTAETKTAQVDQRPCDPSRVTGGTGGHRGGAGPRLLPSIQKSSRS